MAGTTLLRRLAAATVAFGLLAAPAGADPVARAAAPRSELRAAQPVAVPGGGEIRRYRQRAGGLPVLGAEAVVADPAGAPAVLVSDHTVGGLRATGRVRLTRRAAIARAMKTTMASHLRGRSGAHLGIDPASGRIVWEVLIASGEPLADYDVLVDAASGSIVRVGDLLQRLTGSALLYAPNPVVQQAGYAGLSDRDDRDSSLLTNLRLPASLERLTSARGCLEGLYASVGLGRHRKPVCAAGADFTAFTRHSDKFEAEMAYFHIDRTRAYVDSLGLSRPLSAKPQKVLVDAIADDNSFFSPKARTITYGTGGVDDAEDADVIVHEYGHSLQDQAVHLFGTRLQGASMGEGWGDFIAAVMSAQATGGSATYDPCMFEWDATSYTPNACARRTDRALNVGAAKRRCNGDPHCIGEAWSGALWALRAALGLDAAGRAVLDRVVLESHFMLTRKANFRDGARALLAADQLLYGGVHASPIAAEMVKRGFCPARGC